MGSLISVRRRGLRLGVAACRPRVGLLQLPFLCALREGEGKYGR